MRQDASQRNDVILDLIVRSYIDSAEPVGSRTISRHFDLGLSPATVRNVMADLEEQGYLKQPHTSAGRVPTDRGYRYWVDALMQPEPVNEQEKNLIQGELQKVRTIEGLAESICKILSEITGNAVIIYIKNLKRVSFLNYLLEELIQTQKLAEFFEEEPELFIDGAARMFEQPEFQDLAKMRMLLHAFDEKADFLHELMRDPEENGVHVRIGRENDLSDLGDVSLVAKDCYLSDVAIGGVAVVGPTRMKYSKVVSVVDYVADSVTERVNRF
jgi:heat-inducible transcriptional repressor